MNKLLLGFVISLLLVQPVMASGGLNTPDEVVIEIAKSQNVLSETEILCENVTDKQWERLGDAVMSVRIPDQDEHEFMDQMMGGEGSESLNWVHTRMGQMYLDCGNIGDNFGGYDMMGFLFGPMMGGGFFGIIIWLFLLLIIVVVVGLVIWLVGAIDRGGERKKIKSRSALDILDERYAKGEIDNEEYEEMKKSILK